MPGDLVSEYAVKFRQTRDPEALSWLYYHFLCEGLTWEEVVAVFGEPQDQWGYDECEYVSADSSVILWMKWNDDQPRRLVVWKIP